MNITSKTSSRRLDTDVRAPTHTHTHNTQDKLNRYHRRQTEKMCIKEKLTFGWLLVHIIVRKTATLQAL